MTWRMILVIALHVMGVAALAVLAFGAAGREMWWSCGAMAVGLVAVGASLCRLYTRVLDSVQELLKAFPQQGTQDRRRALPDNFYDQMSGMIHRFRDLMAEGEYKRIYYETLLDHVDTALVVAAAGDRVEWMNRAASRWLGDDFRPPREWADGQRRDMPCILSVGHEGARVEAMVSCITLHTRSGLRRLYAVKDIHHLLERNEMEAWQKLIRVLTHEIMNSMTPVLSLSETLCGRVASEPASPELYERMVQSMQTIHRRSQGLLEFIENYRRLTRIPVPIQSVIHLSDLQFHLRDLYRDQPVRVSVTPPDATLWADRTLVEQMLINLIKNALEADEQGRGVEVDLTRDEDGTVRISVTDHGCGILPEVQERIFVPFFTTKPGGSGIGLSLCKQIMSLHGGTIRVTSKPNEGSVFTLVFGDLQTEGRP